jgi:bifunctional ADP-heptose synthase (sugar kinase/adenylyltransferase)
MSVRPNLYVKGSDYHGNINPALTIEVKAVERIGGKFKIINVESKWHSSELLSGKALA